MPMLLAQFALNGISIGSLYAIFGLSWSIIYSTTGTFHFAQMFVITAAAYTAAIFTTDFGLPLIVGLLAAILVAIALGCLIERAIYYPLRRLGATQFSIFVSSMGTAVLGQTLIQLAFSANYRTISGFTTRSLNFSGIAFDSIQALKIALSGLVILIVKIYLAKSEAGKAMRAVACNPTMSEIIGINKTRTYLLTFGLGSGIAAVAAVLYSLGGAVIPSMGMTPFFYCIIVTFLGGVGSISGAVLGGIILGLVQNIPLAFIPSQWQIVITFTILILIVLVRPQGIIEPKK
jgi:branched-chain amino acid transport system permease protein